MGCGRSKVHKVTSLELMEEKGGRIDTKDDQDVIKTIVYVFLQDIYSSSKNKLTI